MIIREGDVIRIKVDKILVTEVTVKRITYSQKKIKPTKIVEINAPLLSEGEAEAEIVFYV